MPATQVEKNDNDGSDNERASDGPVTGTFVGSVQTMRIMPIGLQRLIMSFNDVGHMVIAMKW